MLVVALAIGVGCRGVAGFDGVRVDEWASHGLGVVGTGPTDGLSWLNSPPPPNATSPYDNATFMYCRAEGHAGFSGSRYTPVDLWIHVYDAHGKDITTANPATTAYLRQLHTDVYGWNFTVWRAELERCCAHTANINKTIDTKANLFWELLSVIVARRVLGYHTGADPLLLFGPQCFNTSGGLVCNDSGLAEVASVSVVSRPDGHRDPLNPVTRTISMLFRRPFEVQPVFYDVEVPNMLRVASPRRELLDLNPSIDGDKIPSTMHLRARTPFAPTSYPDYNFYYLPVRHLVLQGQVPNPRLPGSSLGYASAADLQSAFTAVAHGLLSPITAAGIADRVANFLTDKYYYMYRLYNFEYANRTGVSGYEYYLLEQDGSIKDGIGAYVDQVQLIMGNNVSQNATLLATVRRDTLLP